METLMRIYGEDINGALQFQGVKFDSETWLYTSYNDAGFLQFNDLKRLIEYILTTHLADITIKTSWSPFVAIYPTLIIAELVADRIYEKVLQGYTEATESADA
jgi:hypothetical protein